MGEIMKRRFMKQAVMAALMTLATMSRPWIIVIILGFLIANFSAMAQTSKHDPGTDAWADEAKQFRKDRERLKKALEKKDQETLKEIWEERKREATHGGVPPGGGGGRHPLQQAPSDR